ncbi:MAG: phosphoribosyl-AMP cyclohydrolase [Candidatus Brocadiaceae bacterium]|nr:phosphoribosyl-AMP cyclohydrolase [Candidatus Brocadiaceae bacterium]
MQLLEKLHFDEKGLIPSIIADVSDGKVLTLCYMNKDAVLKTIETGKVHVFRRSQNRLMIKGETSGHVQTVKKVHFDCEGNSILFAVEQKIAACHAGYKTCFYREYRPETDAIIIEEKRVFDPDNVYNS